MPLHRVPLEPYSTKLARFSTSPFTDVWEHAHYYVDYRNRRPDYAAAFWNLAHWDFAAQNYAG
ncbi:MAG: hypothetical protein HY067_04230 [Betaproteobacteria bacterium]|nr:hypothetical protein [Betaproteobacteria bacterium]